MKISLLQTGDGSHSLIAQSDHGLSQSYHSHRGAIQESKHVFIEAGLKNLSAQSINLLEVGFGTGLNALLTFAESTLREQQEIVYYGVEPDPIPLEVVNQLNYPMLLSSNPFILYLMHKALINGTPVVLSNQFSFVPLNSTVQDLDLPEQSIDLIYFDAFSPNFQPELWEEHVFQKLYQWMKPEAILVTYCAQSAMQRAMRSVGFFIEKLPGAPGKREMVRARKPATV